MPRHTKPLGELPAAEATEIAVSDLSPAELVGLLQQMEHALDRAMVIGLHLLSQQPVPAPQPEPARITPLH